MYLAAPTAERGTSQPLIRVSIRATLSAPTCPAPAPALQAERDRGRPRQGGGGSYDHQAGPALTGPCSRPRPRQESCGVLVLLGAGPLASASFLPSCALYTVVSESNDVFVPWTSA